MDSKMTAIAITLLVVFGNTLTVSAQPADNADISQVCVAVFDSIEEMQAADNITDGRIVLTRGYRRAGDGGGGMFNWDTSSTEVDDGGLVFISTTSDAGRWKRLFEGPISVLWFGARATSDERYLDRNTAAINSAILAAEAVQGSVRFPPNVNGYITKPVHIKSGHIKLIGEGAKIIQHFRDIQVPPNSGQYKASPVFLILRDADNVEISGFTFTTDDRTFPPSREWASYFASIIIHNADHVSIHHCQFNGGQDRGIFLHGGNYVSVKDNIFRGKSMILHTGYANNSNFFDEGPSSNLPTFSPIGAVIENNWFLDYSHDNNLLFLSGATDFTVRGNKILRVNSEKATAVRLYTNDLGVTDINGKLVNEMRGVFQNNVITGNFKRGLFVFGKSSEQRETVFDLPIDVSANHIEGTGVGVHVQRAPSLRFHSNIVKTSDSALSLAEEIDGVCVRDNHLQTTVKSTTSSSSTVDINAQGQSVTIVGNHIISGPGDEYAVRNIGNRLITDLRFDRNVIEFKGKGELKELGKVARPVQLGNLAGNMTFDDNHFIISDDAGMTDQPLASLHENADVRANVHCRGNILRSPQAKVKGFFITAQNVRCDKNNVPSLRIESTGYVSVTSNHLSGYSSATSTGSLLRIEGGKQAFVEGNVVEMTQPLNTYACEFVATEVTKFLFNRVEGNSTSELVAQISAGTLERLGNTIINSGSGGTECRSTTAAQVVDLPADCEGRIRE
jgi:hypothetical protein